MSQVTRNRIYVGIIAGLLAFILLQKACGTRNGATVRHVLTDTFTIRMKKPKYFTKYVPVPVADHKPEAGKVVAAITDTAGRADSSKCVALAMDYFTERVYNDTMADDTAAIFTKITVRENKIQSMTSGYLVKKPFTTIVNNYQPKPRVQFFMGASFGVAVPVIGQTGPPSQFMAGPQILLKDKSDRIYSLSPSLSTSGELYFSGGMAFKIRVK